MHARTHACTHTHTRTHTANDRKKRVVVALQEPDMSKLKYEITYMREAGHGKGFNYFIRRLKRVDLEHSPVRTAWVLMVSSGRGQLLLEGNVRSRSQYSQTFVFVSLMLSGATYVGLHLHTLH